MTTKRPIAVMVVDDHFVVRTGLAAALGLEADVAVVAEADAGPPVVGLYRRHAPDVVLMDLRLGGADDGVAATRRLLEEFPAARVRWCSARPGGTRRCTRRSGPGPTGTSSRRPRGTSCWPPSGRSRRTGTAALQVSGRPL